MLTFYITCPFNQNNQTIASRFQTPSVARDMTVHDNMLTQIAKENTHRGTDTFADPPSTAIPLESWSLRLQLNLKYKGGYENDSTVYPEDFLKIILCTI